MGKTAEYDDGYATCESTYATLRIYHQDLDPDSVSALLGLQPTRSFARTQTASGYRSKHGAWFLSTEEYATSRDVRRHVDWILAQLEGKHNVLHTMQQSGYRMDIFCYWVSKSGHGGPMLSPSTMRQLADANLPIGFDVYFYDGANNDLEGNE